MIKGLSESLPRKTTTVLLMVLILLNMAFSTGCSREKHQRVTAYTTLDEELARKLFKAFTDETGIKVDWIRLSTGECVARLAAERSNPHASIWFGGVGLGHIEARNIGLTEAYRSPYALMPIRFRDPKFYWTGLYASPLCFESNTEKLKQYGLKPPLSWKDLIKPEYRNHIQMANPGSSGTSYNIISTLIQIFGEEEAFAYLSLLDKNITHYTRSGLAPGKNMSIGEVAIAIGYTHDALKLQKEGYPIEITFPEEGTGYEIASISRIKNAPEKEREAAKLFFDWALQESATKILASQNVVPFHKTLITLGTFSINDVNIVHQDDEWSAANKQRLVEKWNQRIGFKYE
ncbi:MAG: iron ABC transporter substrate-binding protein [Spirochaetaceae bacterium 4572_59]|nr:MAG: iron ABC transporter substrate-binding protein [Spirochaetaceae bacterium 4572_59]